MKSSTINSTLTGITHRFGFFEYLVVFVLIIYLGNANRLILLSSIREVPLVFMVPVLFSGVLLLKYRVPFTQNFYLLILTYLIYFMALTIKFKTFYPSFLIHYLFIFFTSYVLIKALKYELFNLYEYLIYLLSIIGLLMWLLQMVLGGDTLYGILSHIPNIREFSHVTGNGFNVVLYSVQPTTTSVLYNNLPPRNSGFAWEPGGFAVYLCLAIFINLFFNKSDKNRKLRLTVLLIALISTQSTTGFVILIIIGLFYYLNTNLRTVFLILPLLVLGIVLIISLPFMTEKIISLADDIHMLDEIVAAGYGRETSITPQRFSSFMIAIKDFFLNPLLGTGGFPGESWTAKIGVNVSTISGIGNLLANFGLVGFLFFMIISFRTSVLYSKHFGYKGNILFLLIMISISISYGILFMPLILCFWIFALFEN